MNWNLFENLLINMSFGLLLTSLLFYWTRMAFTHTNYLYIIGRICVYLTNFCLFIALLLRWSINGYFPLSNLYESLLFLTWCLTFTQIILEHKNRNLIIGSISIPISLFVICFASFCLPLDMKEASPLVPALQSNWLMMHVTIMMLSYASLIIGSLLSMLFLIISKNNQNDIQDKHIDKKSKFYRIHENSLTINKTVNITKITLLESIDHLSYRTIGLGFPLLTIGIIAGAVWANEAWGSYWSWDPKETWALITWLVFASYLHSRLNKSWTGKKPAILASIGFLVVWICYLGVNFLGQGLHSYGWLQ